MSNHGLSASHEIHSALSTEEQWQQLEHDLFSGAGEALTRLRDCARSNQVQPVPFVVQCAQYALSAIPGPITIDAGKGKGCKSLFTVIVGAPGSGKDRLMSTVMDSLKVFEEGSIVPLEPQPLHSGSGEGIVERMSNAGSAEAAPKDKSSDKAPAHPFGLGNFLMGVSEVGGFVKQMQRENSTLRPFLLSMYSGNALGVSIRGSVTSIAKMSYTVGLWVAAQPELAASLVDGKDDGFRHRFVWTEAVDPFMTKRRDGKQVEPLTVHLPKGAINPGAVIDFPDSVKRQVQEEGYLLASRGVTDGHSGHRTFTRAKLAAGLALLQSAMVVTEDDWQRAGVLMDYSDKVANHYIALSSDYRIRQELDRLEIKDGAREQFNQQRDNKRKKWVKEVLELAQSNSEALDRGEAGGSIGEYSQKKNGGDKRQIKGIVEELCKREVIALMDDGKRPSGVPYPGDKFGEYYGQLLGGGLD